MHRNKHNSVHSVSSLDTLANKGTSASDKYNSEGLHKFEGEGTSKESMKKRPTKKMLDQHIALALINVAKRNGDDFMLNKYWNTWHCFDTIKTNGDRAFGNYCKNRFCSVCNGNRKARLIRQYKPIIEQWEEPYFLTLTRKSVKKPFLLKTINDNNRKFRTIINRLKKRHQRGKGPKIVALRSTECNYNPVEGSYNPHFHIITENREIGRLLLIEWLKEQNKNQSEKIARPSGQHLVKIKDREKNLIEVIKYGVKVLTDPDMKKGKNRTQLPIIYAAAMHEIHKAFSGKNLLSKYGFSLLQSDHEAKVQYVEDSKVKTWSYDPQISNFIEEETGEVMYPNKYLPSPEMEYLAKERIDKFKT